MMKNNNDNPKVFAWPYPPGVTVLSVALLLVSAYIFQDKLKIQQHSPIFFYLLGAFVTIILSFTAKRIATIIDSRPSDINTAIAFDTLPKNIIPLTELTLWGVFDSSVTGIAIINLNGKFSKTNDEFNSILGYSEKELKEHYFQDLTHPDDAEACIFYWQNSLAGGPATLRSEKRYINKSGAIIWVALNVVLIKDKQNNPIHFIVQIDDITVRKRLAEQLIEKEEQLRVFAEHSPACQVMLDRDMRYLIISDRCKKEYGIPGVPNEELIGKCHYDMFPAFPQHWKDINTRCLAGAVERSDEEPYVGSDGTIQWMTYEVRPWHKANGDIGGVIVFTEPITNIKEAELKFRSLVEKSMVGVYIIQKESFSYVNPRLAEMFGYTEEEMQGMPIEKLIHTDHKRTVKNAIATGKAGEETIVKFESRGIDIHGETLWFETFGSNTLYNGSPAIIGTLIDITGRKNNENIIKDKIAQLETITNNLPGIVVYQAIREANGDRRFLYMSNGVERITGLPADDKLLGLHINELIHAEDRESLANAEIECFKNYTILTQQVRMNTYRGDELIIDVRALPSKQDDGTIIWDGILTDITEIKRTATDLLNKNNEIKERVKELTCLHYISEITSNPNLSVIEILSKCVQIIPPAYRFPEHACARIKYFNKDFQTENFKESVWLQQSLIYVDGNEIGTIEVFYLQDVTMEDTNADAFLSEEQSLINSIAEILGGLIERRKADAELKESEQKFRTLVEQSLVGVIILQQDKFVYVNHAFENISGYNRQELLNRLSFENIVHEDYLPTMEAITYNKNEDAGKSVTLKIVRSAGDCRHIEIISSSIVYNGSPAYIATVIDITDKVLEEQRISKAITQTQEQERMQIGMDLHDNVNQLLSASNIYLGLLKNKLDDKPNALQMIESVKTFILDANNEIRNLSHQLAPALDPSATLKYKIEGLLYSIRPEERQLEVIIDIYEDNDAPYSHEIQTTIYRIIQEQLNNIQKYAKASSLLVKIESVKSQIILLLKDNGIGFDTAIKKGGIGLGNIHRRALSLGGKAEIISSPGNGCEIIVSIPLNN